MNKTSRIVFVLFAAVAAMLSAYAAPIVAVGPVVAAPGTSGNVLEVALTNADSDPLEISAFSFLLHSASPWIQFTSVDIFTVQHPYVFAGSSFVGDYLGGLSGPVSSITPGADIDASDASNAASGYATVAPGATVSLGRVHFDVSANALAGPVALSFSGYPDTGLAIVNGGEFENADVEFGHAQVAVAPEPAGYAAVGLALLAAARALRRFGIVRARR